MVVSELQPSTAKKASLGIDALPAIYTFKDQEQVRQFLEANPLAPTLLQEASVPLSRVFGAETPIRLEVVSEPEFPQQRQLCALIMADMGTPEKAEEAEQRLRRLHEEWLIHLPRAHSGNVHFDVEFA